PYSVLWALRNVITFTPYTTALLKATVDIFLIPFYILVFIVGLVANGWGLKSLLHNWRKLKIINVFVLNLGLADILYLLTLPFLVVYYFMKSKWIIGEAFCKITRFCFNVNLYGSIGFLTCLSVVYRYLAIVHPVKVMGRLTVTHSDYLKYSLGWTLTGFCIPFLITLGCYGHVAVVLWTLKRTDKVLKQRSLKLLFILILLFSVCYIPYYAFRNLELWSRVLKKQGICYKWYNGVYIARQISRVLVCLNSALNPLVYLHAHEDIPAQLRQQLQQVCKCCSKRCGHKLLL
uniref:Si:dkey-78k11.9 n=1 Tax=Sparus aurata TaxID=8175 RepID=A0A671UYG8_SPAAU